MASEGNMFTKADIFNFHRVNTMPRKMLDVGVIPA